MEVHAISTQGLHATEQFVSEFIVQYSDDGQAWRNIISADGETEVFHMITVVCDAP